MNLKGKLFLETLSGIKTERVPFWFMRQAGRFLPEFKQVRKETGTFLDLCFNSEKASEVTLQPIHRFDMDAAIIFSDILVVPYAMGIKTEFLENYGPKLGEYKNASAVGNFNHEKISAVYKAIKITREKLPKEKTLIGFAGAPFTICCYIVDGSSEFDFAKTKQLYQTSREEFLSLIDNVTSGTIDHLKQQINAGANVVQVFDSWAGMIDNKKDFEDFVIKPTRKITEEIKKSFPGFPVIGFPRKAKENYIEYSKYSGVDCVGFDESVTTQWILENIDESITIQGNLDNNILKSNKAEALEQTAKILNALKSRKHIFNLGHGVLPETPIENVEAVSALIKNFRK